jgi:uncharacterized protein (TIGR03437 family)
LIVVSACASSTLSEKLSKLPFRFEANGGRDPRKGVLYTARGSNVNLSLGPDENWLTWTNQSSRRKVDVHTRLVGANRAAQMAAEDLLPGAANYFVGAREQWRTDISGYRRVRSRGIYPGIDLVFHGDEGQIEYDFILEPGADPGLIRLELNGQRSLSIAENGDLVIATTAGDVRWKRPEVYQNNGAARVSVSGRYVLAGNRTVKFELGGYNHQRELTIDPTLAYATFLGGTRNDLARGIALDGSGNVYLAGNTTSMTLPTASAFQPNFGGASTAYNMYGDAFVAKFNSAGALVYLTYLGGSADDGATAIAVDAAGNAYITGATTSPNFPTMNPYQAHFGGLGGLSAVHSGDAFVTKLNPAGNQLIYSTYLGGSLDDIGTAITVDGAGNAYVAGATASPNFPISASPYQGGQRGAGGQPINPDFDAPGWDPGDAFAVRLNASGQLVAGTYLGGSLDDVAFAIALDSSGNVYLGGCTISENFPTTAGAVQRNFGGIDENNFFRNSGDGFIAELDPMLGKLLYSTFLGGSGDDLVSGIAVDSSGNIYVTGSTTSGNFATPGAFQLHYAGVSPTVYAEQNFGDAYVAKINPSQTTPVYLTYLGGTSNDAGAAIAIDSAGNAYVTGFTDSSDFPLAGNPLQSGLAGDGGQALYEDYGDAFVVVVNPTGTALLYSSYYGGRYDDEGYGIALDASGNVYITGNTVSVNLPTTSTAAQKVYGGGLYGAGGFSTGDAYYAVFSGLVSAHPAISKVANAEGEGLTIAPNTWVEIKGSNLAPAVSSPGCAPGYCWQASDFVNNQLPTTLQGVKVTLNGENAFVYYISGSQINILTPPDLKAGPVTVQVINNGVASATFTAQAATVSESFFVFNGGPYIVAEHLFKTSSGAVALVGPTTLYPGLTSPAAALETIVIYTNGFGATTVPVVSGSETQSGTLPVLPAIQIGNATAQVTFAGLISPGLYQFNVIVPASVQSGDNPIQVTYNGQTTQAGALITIK